MGGRLEAFPLNVNQRGRHAQAMGIDKLRKHL